MEQRILIYGYGNPGRQDDALGTQLAENMREWASASGLKHVAVETTFQLNIEDAQNIQGYDKVIFVDASQESFVQAFLFQKLEPKMEVEFSMHAVSPSFVVGLANELFGKCPECYLLSVRGYEWQFEEGLSISAKNNFNLALKHLTSKILTWSRVSSSIESMVTWPRVETSPFAG